MMALENVQCPDCGRDLLEVLDRPSRWCPECGHIIGDADIQPLAPTDVELNRLEALVGKRPQVITRLLTVDQTGTVANYIRSLEDRLIHVQSAHAGGLIAELEKLKSLCVRADSYLSLLWHRHVPRDRKGDTEFQRDVEQTIGDLRAAYEVPRGA